MVVNMGNVCLGLMFNSKFATHSFHRKSVFLSFISCLLFVVVLFSFCFVSVFNNVSPFVLGASNNVVNTEFELRNAVTYAPSGASAVIALANDISLTDCELTIPAGKDLTLTSAGDVMFKLIGASGQDTVIVEGLLRLDGLIVTHDVGVSGRGVSVVSGGKLVLISGEVSGNVADAAGGVSNEGTFEMLGGLISDNTAKINDGGGVRNSGTFTMKGGEISNNTASFGGGVSNWQGTFEMFGGVISGNTANWNGGGVLLYSAVGLDSGVIRLFNGVISDNIAYRQGGGVGVSAWDLENVFVSNGVVFKNNRADMAYNRDSAHDEVYRTQIGTDITWTYPFTQGYNNYDIQYTNGTQFTGTSNGGYVFFVVALILALGIAFALIFYFRKRGVSMQRKRNSAP